MASDHPAFGPVDMALRRQSSRGGRSGLWRSSVVTTIAKIRHAGGEGGDLVKVFSLYACSAHRSYLQKVV